MRIQSAALFGMMLLAGCSSGPSSSSGRPAIPALAAAQSLDDADRAFTTDKFNHAMETSLSGQTSSWATPGGYQVQVSPTRMYQKADGTYCREFTQSISEAKSQAAATQGTTCRQSDGTWQIVG